MLLTFEQEKVSKRIGRKEMSHQEIRFRLPLELSEDQDLSKIRFHADPQFAFAKFNIVRDGAKTCVEVSFPPRMLEKKMYQGNLYVSNAQGAIKRSTKLLVERVDDIQSVFSSVKCFTDLWAQSEYRNRKHTNRSSRSPFHDSSSDLVTADNGRAAILPS